MIVFFHKEMIFVILTFFCVEQSIHDEKCKMGGLQKYKLIRICYNRCRERVQWRKIFWKRLFLCKTVCFVNLAVYLKKLYGLPQEWEEIWLPWGHRVSSKMRRALCLQMEASWLKLDFLRKARTQKLKRDFQRRLKKRWWNKRRSTDSAIMEKKSWAKYKMISEWSTLKKTQKEVSLKLQMKIRPRKPINARIAPVVWRTMFFCKMLNIL